MNTIIAGENLTALKSLPDGFADLIYIDPPFNTGKIQKLTSISTSEDDDGDRVGFGGKKYKTTVAGSKSYNDQFDDFKSFIQPRIQEAYRLLKPTGSFFFHIDYREVHYCKVWIDEVFGRDCFKNEIIWAYDYGAKPKTRWATKHDNILWYTKNPDIYTFHDDEVDRIPYMAPGLAGKEKAERGKKITDVWWNTIVPTNGSERTGYPTQKPLAIINRIVRVHSNPGEIILDFFAGSGTTGEAAAMNGRLFTLVDQNPESISVMINRLSKWNPQIVNFGVENIHT